MTDNRNALVPIEIALPSTELAADLDVAASFAMASMADSTLRAYGSDWRVFLAWAGPRGVQTLPAAPETVAAFLAHEAQRGRKASTIGRRCAAIRHAHRLAGFEPPTGSEIVRTTTKGIRRTIGVAPVKKQPMTNEKVVMAVAGGRTDSKGLRDRAIVLLGFATAMRRSELVALDVEDLEFTDQGLRVTIRKSKTDQEGLGATIAVVSGSIVCPIEAVRAWLEAANIASGPIFRPVRRGGRVVDARLSAQTIADITKDAAKRLGLDAAQFGAHSLRAGFLTSAAMKGANIWKLCEVSRHKSLDVLRGYIRNTELFKNHAGEGLL